MTRLKPYVLHMTLVLGLFVSGCATSDKRLTAVPNMWETMTGGSESDFMQAVSGQPVRFVRPVAVAARGNFIFIVDEGLEAVFRYDRDIGRLKKLVDLRGLNVVEASDIFIDSDLSFYLTDTGGGRVFHYSRDGDQLDVLQDRFNLSRPVAVVTDAHSDRLLVADGFNDDVIVYNRAGLLLGAVGIRGGKTPGTFRAITAMAQGPDGIYVTSRLGDDHVQVMSHDGDYLSSFEKGKVIFPGAIAVDSNNRAYVSDLQDNTIKVFQNGVYVDTLGGSGSAPGRFMRITDLWLDEGVLYVADSLNGRIQFMRVTSERPSPESMHP